MTLAATTIAAIAHIDAPSGRVDVARAIRAASRATGLELTPYGVSTHENARNLILGDCTSYADAIASAVGRLAEGVALRYRGKIGDENFAAYQAAILAIQDDD